MKVDAAVVESSSEPGDRGFSCATAVIRRIVFLFVSVNSEMIYVLAGVRSLFIYYKGRRFHNGLYNPEAVFFHHRDKDETACI